MLECCYFYRSISITQSNFQVFFKKDRKYLQLEKEYPHYWVCLNAQQWNVHSSATFILLFLCMWLTANWSDVLNSYRRTHASRVLGPNNGSKPRQQRTQSSVPLNTMGITSVSSSIANLSPVSESSFRLPRVELNSVEENHTEQFSTTSGSTAVTMHDIPSMANT